MQKLYFWIQKFLFTDKISCWVEQVWHLILVGTAHYIPRMDVGYLELLL